MDNPIFSEIIGFLQNSSDGKTIANQTNLPPEDMHKIAQEVIPKITEKMKNSPQTLGDLFSIFMQNKDDPQSLLNAQPGFDQQKAQSEGHDILKALFGGRQQTAQVAEEVSQKTGISAIDISSLLPVLAAMATKILSGKADTAAADGENSTEAKNNYFSEILGFLDANKDGSISDDLGRIGQQILGEFFGDKKNP